MIEYSPVFVINRNKILIICLETRKIRESLECQTTPLDFLTEPKFQTTSKFSSMVRSFVTNILVDRM